jgi:D-3-phosphoglycerate dehydrogenase
VNAPSLARARGINLDVHKTADAGRYSSLLTLRGERSVSGTVASGESRLVALDGYEVDLAPAAHMLVSRHEDRPGAIGLVGQTLGEADVNISAMHLGRSDKRSIAFMILALDEQVPEEAAERIRSYDAMLDVWLISLDAPG